MNNQRTNQRTNSTSHQQDDWDMVHNQLLDIQKKSLAVSDPNDAEEKEADAVATKVTDGESAQIHGTNGSIQRKGDGNIETTPGFQSKLENSKGNGHTLDDSSRSEFESKMGADFSGVKIHTGSEANAMNENVNAKAFTHGQDIYFKNENYNPASAEGKELLAHELVHTVQQKGETVSRKIQRRILSKEAIADKQYGDDGKVDSYYIIQPSEVEATVTAEAVKWYEGIKTNLSAQFTADSVDKYLAFKSSDEAKAKAIEILNQMATVKNLVYVRKPGEETKQQSIDYDFKFEKLAQINNAVLFRLSEVQNMYFANTGVFARYNRDEDKEEGTEGFNMRTDKMIPVELSTGKKAAPGNRAFKSAPGESVSGILDQMTSQRSTRSDEDAIKGKNYDLDQRILIDCRTMISLVQLMSFRDVTKDDAAFDKNFEHGGVTLAPFNDNTTDRTGARIDKTTLPVNISTLDDLVVGDVVNFSNKDDYSDFTEFNNSLLWSSEWAIYTGKIGDDHMFEGFGARETYDDMIDALMTEYQKGYDSVKNDPDFKTKYGNKKYDFVNVKHNDFFLTVNHQLPGLTSLVFRPDVNFLMDPK